MDEELEHICDEAETGRKTIRKLEEQGITTFKKLIRSRKILDPTTESEKNLLKVIDWYKWFKRENGRNPDILNDFTTPALNDFKNDFKKTVEVPEAGLQKVFRLLKDQPDVVEMVEKSGMMPRLQESEVKSIIGKLTATMENTLAHFDHEGFSHEVVKAVYSNPKDDMPIVFVAGKTQVGKASVNGLAMLCCHEAHVPIVVLTHGVPESTGQANKLKHFSQGTPLEKNVTAISCRDPDGKRMSKHAKNTEIEAALLSNGAVVCADTAHQIRRIMNCLKKFREDSPTKKFVLIVDECDAVICRTSDRRTQIEQAYDDLRAMRPALTIMISATPVPLMVEVIQQPDYNSKAVSAFFSIDPKEEYVGFPDMVQLRDSEGNTVCLDQKEVTHGNLYFSSSERILIEDALEDLLKIGVLYLDCSNPRVYAEGNVRQKAARVQKRCWNKYGRKVVVMINIGKGIFVRAHGGEWQTEKNKDVSEVIEQIDHEHGLETPIFCFGFTKMRRGTSYRSSRRVPTHINVVLGRGHNIMNLVQTLGRATFNGKSILKKNGFEAVKVLTPPQDYATVEKLLNYVDHISQEIIAGKTFHSAMTGAGAAIPDAANFLRHTTRPVSQIKRHREHLESFASFEKPPVELSQVEILIKKQHFHKEDHQRVLRTIFECTKDHFEVNIDDIFDGYTDTYDETIKKTDLRKILTELVRDAVIEKGDKNKTVGKSKTGDTGWYKVMSRPRIHQYINDELALTASEVEDEVTLREALGLEDSDSMSISNESSCGDSSETSNERVFVSTENSSETTCHESPEGSTQSNDDESSSEASFVESKGAETSEDLIDTSSDESSLAFVERYDNNRSNLKNNVGRGKKGSHHRLGEESSHRHFGRSNNSPKKSKTR